MLPRVCLITDHRRRQNVVRTSMTHSAIASCATFLFLPHFDVICDLLLNRRTATWNLFVKHTMLNALTLTYPWGNGEKPKNRKSLQTRGKMAVVSCFRVGFSD